MLSEANETFTFNLSGASGATIAKAQGTGTILNDDQAAPTPDLQLWPTSRSREGNPVTVPGSAGGRRHGFLPHARQPDRRCGGQRGEACRRELVRHGVEPLCAGRPACAQLQGDDAPDGGSGLQHHPPALLRPAVRRRQHAQRHRLRQEPGSGRPQRASDHGQDRRLCRRRSA